ncbi:MAG: LysM peptidoglycan-binding domain-containing protein [Gemmatimonadaceae bacterium]|nr:LysM peptidoglycan-binding domain-containing protein [Gemmatimonadaceae bacterium]
MSRIRLLPTIALAGLVLAPLPVMAQAAAQTHTVKKGDTLWDIARTYLGDPFKWPEIYRRNTETVKDPNLIYPDQVLVITGEVAPSPGTPSDSAMTPALPSPAPTPTADPAAPVPDAPAAPMAEAQGPPPAMTIFNPSRFRGSRARRTQIEVASRPVSVRPGDFARAPFLWDAAGITGAGQVGAAVQPVNVAVTRYERPVQLYERVFVTMPANATGAMNEELMSYRYGPEFPGEGRVVVPTGRFRVVSAPANGRAEAILLSKYEDVYTGQGLIVADTLQMPANVAPTRVEFGLRTSVVWLYGEPVVSSIGQQVILAAGATDGLVPGDQVTVIVELAADAQGDAKAPREIAVLQVTRVTNWGASAVLIGQTEGVLTPGMAARVTAKMP